MKRFLLISVVIIAVFTALLFTPPLSHIRNFVGWGVHSVHDYKTHPTEVVEKSANPQYWVLDSMYNQRSIPDSLMMVIDSNDTHAFLVFQDGKLLYEKYFDGYDKTTLSGSFSAAKSIISMLIGIAIDEGKIKSVNEPVASYINHFKEGKLANIKIKDLLTMSSGTSWDESDTGYFSLNGKAYYGDDMEYLVKQFEYKEPAGKTWEYRSGDTQTLGLIVEKVFGKSVADLTSEKLLQPMGAEAGALWLLDGSEKHAKAFCCYNGVARDYARFGHLILNNGSWNGKQLVSEAYMKEATTPALFLQDPTEDFAPVDYYGYQFWILNYRNLKVNSMNGLFGQYVYAIPDKNAVVVRLGESKITYFVHHSQPENFTYIDAALAVLD
jgi:CubicO group peptidase (beta-lactamase class C family)